jgi:hypothetical protein
MSIDPVSGMGGGVPPIHGADSVHAQHHQQHVAHHQQAQHQQAHDAAVRRSALPRAHVHACTDPACTAAPAPVRSPGVAIGFAVFFLVVLALVVGIAVTAFTGDPFEGSSTTCVAVDGREVPCPDLP